MIKLLELRNEKELSQREIAEVFNICQATYNNWENGKSKLSIEVILELAKYFGVSTDYLLGNSDDLGNIVYSESFLKKKETELLTYFRKLSITAQQTFLDFLKNTTRN